MIPLKLTKKTWFFNSLFDPDGSHLGTLNTGVATANCGWGDDGSVLYITADMYLCRIRLTTQGY